MKASKIILMYHSVAEPGAHNVGAKRYSVSIKKFMEQMEFVSSQAPKRTNTQAEITFDDGLLDNYTNAYPILKRLGLRAYFFILVGKIGTSGYMDWDQIRVLKEAGMIIGSHGMTHRILIKLSADEIENDLRDSKRILEENLRAPVKYLSIPRGFYNNKIMQKAKEIGYEAVFTSDLGVNASEGNDLFKFSRIPVRNSLTTGRFIEILNGKFMLKEVFVNSLKKIIQDLIGIRNYERLTMVVHK